MARSITVPKGREGWYFELEAKPWIYQEIYRYIMRWKGVNYREAVQYTNVNYSLFFVSDSDTRYFTVTGLENWILNRLKETNDVYAGGVQEAPTEREDSEHEDRLR